MARDIPYGGFNFIVKFDGAEAMGGFSDVSGLGTEFTMAEYRNGNEAENHVRKVPMIHKASDVTLKRGLINSEDLRKWINDTRSLGPVAKKVVVITLRDESGTDIQKWQLRGVLPMKYTGPTLAAKGGSDVAMEELVLSAEELDFIP
jgi:phage tail-like protein